MMTAEAHLAWRRYLNNYARNMAVAQALAAHEVFPVALVRSSLTNLRERSAALAYAQQLPTDAKKALFPEILAIASKTSGLVIPAQRIILSLPLTWLLANIEAYAEELLTAQRPYEEYQCLLDLYYSIDVSLTRRLATQAMQHLSSGIRKMGEDFLIKLDG
jgi:hypothetical protein